MLISTVWMREMLITFATVAVILCLLMGLESTQIAELATTVTTRHSVVMFYRE